MERLIKMESYKFTGMGDVNFHSMNDYSSFGYSDLADRGRSYPFMASAGGMSYE
tara:strand:- start:1140 stop:1301 length:162 start_codon:yes stop_codon:yes gene_type:complete